MLKELLIRWLALMVAFAVLAWLVPSVEIGGGFGGLLLVSALFALVDAIVGPLLRLISLPLTVITFGLFSLVVNGLLLALTAGLSSNLDVGGFGAAILAALVLSILNAITQLTATALTVRSPAHT